MPVDTSVYRLLETPPPVATSTEVAAKKQTLANMAQAHDLQAEQIATQQSQRTGMDLENAERSRQIQEAQAVRDILAREPDLTKALPEVMRVSPQAGAVFAKHVDEQRKAALERFEKRRNLEADFASKLLGAKPEDRPAMAKVHHAVRHQSNLYSPQELTQWPAAVPDEAELRAVADQVAIHKQAEEERASAEAKRKQQLHDAELPGKKVNPDTGLNPFQTATVKHSEAVEKNTAKHNEAVEKNQAEANRIRATRLSQIGEQTANSQAIDRRQREKAVAALEEEESKLHELRSKIGNALKHKNVYVDRLGNTKRMNSMDDDEKRSLLSEMEETFAKVTGDLKRVVTNKNQGLQDLGRKVGVSTADAISVIDGGNPKPAAAKAAPSPTTRTSVTKAQVQAYADAHFGGDYAKAAAAVRAQGKTVQ